MLRLSNLLLLLTPSAVALAPNQMQVDDISSKVTTLAREAIENTDNVPSLLPSDSIQKFDSSSFKVKENAQAQADTGYTYDDKQTCYICETALDDPSFETGGGNPQFLKNCKNFIDTHNCT